MVTNYHATDTRPHQAARVADFGSPTDYFLPDPARYTSADFIQRLIKKRLHVQPIEVLMAGFYQNGELVSVRTFARGDSHQVRVPLGRILRHAQRIDATALAMAHNHVNNTAAPSGADKIGTCIAFEGCWRCGIELRDELIFSRNAIYSMCDFGPWPKALETYTAIRNRTIFFPT